MEFPKISDFDEPRADTYDPFTPTPESSPEPEVPPQLLEEIVVEQPPALQVFTTYGPDFQSDDDPPSFADALRRPDKDY